MIYFSKSLVRYYMTKKLFGFLACGLSALVLTCACQPNAPTDNSAAAKALLADQVTETEQTYNNLYERSARNGGLFNTTQETASVLKAISTNGKIYALAEELEPNENSPEEGSDSDKNILEEPTIPDTSIIISQIVDIVKDIAIFDYARPKLLETYVLDVFAYTQIASAIVDTYNEEAFTHVFNVDYDYNDYFIDNFRTSDGWVSKIPEEMSIEGFDKTTSKVNINFKARDAKDNHDETKPFERVNSEMYYNSDDDFGYAQITTRYDNLGNYYESGFNYFSMKDRMMIEICFNANGVIKYATSFDGMHQESKISAENRILLQNYFKDLEEIFAARTNAFVQYNLALAEEAEITEVEKESETVYKKNIAENAVKVEFDYDVLATMMGGV